MGSASGPAAAIAIEAGWREIEDTWSTPGAVCGRGRGSDGRMIQWSVFPPHPYLACGPTAPVLMPDIPMPGTKICTVTGISIPECACAVCTERMLHQFAPERIRIREVRSHDPLRLDEVRSRGSLPSVGERLYRPAL